MKKCKYILCLSLILSLFISNFSLAGECPEYISEKEYVQMMKDLCAKYDADFELSSTNPEQMYCLDEVNTELHDLEEHFKNDRVIYMDLVHIDMDDYLQTRAPEITVTKVKYTTINYGLVAYARFSMTATMVIDPRYNLFISMSNVSTKQDGNSLNFVSWQQTGYSYDLAPNRQNMWIYVNGRIHWSYTGVGGSIKNITENRELACGFVVD